MNTTTAAARAGVTVATIRTWCRIGAVAATKTAGRWTIDAASLARRIAIGKDTRMADTPMYRIEEGVNRFGTTTYTVVRADGAKNDSRIYNATYEALGHAEIHAAFVNRTPAEYRVTREFYPARSIRSGYYWKARGARAGDPTDFNHKWDDGQEVKGNNWPSSHTPVDVLISLALRHAEGADARIAKQAEADAIAAAEAAVREARQAQLAEAGELATPRQVEYILRLLAARERSGEGGGFFVGPKTRGDIALLSKGAASTYITSLTGNY